MVDPVTTTAGLSVLDKLLIGSSVLGAGGQLLGGIFGGESGERQIKETPAAPLDINADRVQSVLRGLGLLGVGVFDEDVFKQGSPAQQLINEFLAAGDLREKDVERFSIALAGVPGRPGFVQTVQNTVQKFPDATDEELARRIKKNFRSRFSGGAEARVFQQLMGRANLTLDQLIEREIKFHKDLEADSVRLQEVADAVQAGRFSALEGIAALQQDFPLATQTDIDETQALFEERLTGTLDRNLADIRADAAQRANKFRISPAATFARLDEAELFERGDIPLTALESAGALLELQTLLGAAGIEALQGSVSGSDALALATTPSASGLVDLTLGGLSQASALAGLRPDVNTTGLGVSGALDTLGRGLGNIALLRDDRQQFQSLQDQLNALVLSGGRGPGVGNEGIFG